MIFLVVVALGYLLSLAGVVRVLAIGLVAFSFVRLGPALEAEIEFEYAPFLPAERRLVTFLDGHETPPVSLTSHAQQLAALSRHRFHLIDCPDPPEQTRRLFRHLGLDYLIVYPEDRRCSFLEGLEDEFTTVFVAGRGAGHIVLMKPRESAWSP
jgi:hypothetical protein